ncbi:MAG: ABC transporter ATP-binding protein [Nostocoides sp.]
MSGTVATTVPAMPQAEPNACESGLIVQSLAVEIGSIPLINDATMLAPAGALTALVGPNGAGKSTLLRALVGALPVANGQAWFRDEDLLRMPAHHRARRVAMVEQQPTTGLDLLVSDVVSLGRIPYRGRFGLPHRSDAEVIEDAMEVTGTTAWRDRSFGTLSGGERQRVHLAAALAQQPKLILIDEPTNHLDIRAQLETLDLLGDLAGTGLTVLAALHDLNHAVAHAGHVVALGDGRVLAEGLPDKVLTRELIAELYGVRAELATVPSTGHTVFAFHGAEAGPS